MILCAAGVAVALYMWHWVSRCCLPACLTANRLIFVSMVCKYTSADIAVI